MIKSTYHILCSQFKLSCCRRFRHARPNTCYAIPYYYAVTQYKIILLRIVTWHNFLHNYSYNFAYYNLQTQLAVQNVIEGAYYGRNYILRYVNFILTATVLQGCIQVCILEAVVFLPTIKYYCTYQTHGATCAIKFIATFNCTGTKGHQMFTAKVFQQIVNFVSNHVPYHVWY